MARPSNRDPKAIRDLTALRAQILQLASQGKLVPQIASEEPAERLIARVSSANRFSKSRTKVGRSAFTPVTDDGTPHEVPDTWLWTRLGDFTEGLETGWSPTCERFPSRSNDEWGVIKTTAIYGMEFDDAENKALPPAFEPRPRIEIRAGDLLLTRKGPRSRAGICCYVEQVRPRLMVCDTVYRFRVNEDLVLSRFIELLMNTPSSLTAIDELKTGASESGLNLRQGDVLALPLPLPPIAEQERILEKVDELMAAIGELEALLRRVEALRPKLLQLGVQGDLNTRDATDEPAKFVLERVAARRRSLIDAKAIQPGRTLPPIRADEIPYDLPPGWIWVRAGDAVLGVEYGHTASASYEQIDGPRFVRITDIDERNEIDWSNVPRCKEPSDRGRSELRVGDIVVARTGTVGKATLVNTVPERAVFASYLVRLRDAEVGLAPYLFTFVRSPVYWGQIVSATAGSAQPNVNGTKLARLVVPLPPLEEQRRIETRLDELMLAIDAVQLRGSGRR